MLHLAMSTLDNTHTVFRERKGHISITVENLPIEPIESHVLIIPQIADSHETHCSLHIKESDVMTMNKVTVVGEDREFLISKEYSPLVLKDGTLVCFDPKTKAIVGYEEKMKDPISCVVLSSAPDEEIYQIIVSPWNDWIIYSVNVSGRSLKEQDLFIIVNSQQSFIGTGYLPFISSENDIMFLRDGVLWEYDFSTNKRTKVLDSCGNLIFIDANPYFTRRLIYDPSANILAYTVPSTGLLADDSWRNIKMHFVDNGDELIVRMNRWICDIFWEQPVT